MSHSVRHLAKQQDRARRKTKAQRLQRWQNVPTYAAAQPVTRQVGTGFGWQWLMGRFC